MIITHKSFDILEILIIFAKKRIFISDANINISVTN